MVLTKVRYIPIAFPSSLVEPVKILGRKLKCLKYSKRKKENINS